MNKRASAMLSKYAKNKFIGTNYWENWSLNPEAIESILNKIPEGSTILELGSGRSSSSLVELYKVYTVEDNVEYINKNKDVVYIHAPLKSYVSKDVGEIKWYDPEVLAKELPKEYDCIIVDGPYADVFSRHGFIDHIELFKMDVPILFDDASHPFIYYTIIQTMNVLRIPDVLIEHKLHDKAFCWLA